jgi:hypothetical protein
MSTEVYVQSHVYTFFLSSARSLDLLRSSTNRADLESGTAAIAARTSRDRRPDSMGLRATRTQQMRTRTHRLELETALRSYAKAWRRCCHLSDLAAGLAGPNSSPHFPGRHDTQMVVFSPVFTRSSYCEARQACEKQLHEQQSLHRQQKDHRGGGQDETPRTQVALSSRDGYGARHSAVDFRRGCSSERHPPTQGHDSRA